MGAELIAALAGAIVGGASAWQLARLDQARQLRAFSAAVAAEIHALVGIARSEAYSKLYRQLAGSIRHPDYDGEFDALTIPSSHNYFSVFEGNVSQVGHLSPLVALRLVSFYQAARAWLDSASAANVGGDGTMTRDEAIERYEGMASRLDAICALGDELVQELAPSAGGALVAVSQRLLLR